MTMRVKLYLCGGENPISQFPLGLGYLKSNCENRDIDISIVSASSRLTDCDLIGLSANAWGISEANDILQKSKVPVVLGGQGALWGKCASLGFKNVVVGEGESAFSRILRGDSLPVAIEAEQVGNIDTLRFPHRGHCGKVVPVLTSRGCPYKCNFCSSQHFWQKVRFHSADYFMGEIEYISKEYPQAAKIYILDDLFIANRQRLFDIHKRWMDGAWHKKYVLEAFIRSNLFTEEIGAAMKEMGFAAVRFGAESGSDRMLKILNKQTTVANHQRTIDIANKIGLPVTASFMHHLPEETAADRRSTRDFIDANKGRMAVKGYYRFKAFPGTKWYDGEDLLTADMRVR